MRPIIRKVLYIVVCLIIGVEIYVLTQGISQTLKDYKWQSNYLRFVENLRKPYKEDGYGGKTPEETWSMFMTALEKGDVELASKYFEVDKQQEYKSIILKLKNSNKLSILKNIRKSLNQPNNLEVEQYFSIDYHDDELGKLTERVIFRRNFYSKLWKISLM